MVVQTNTVLTAAIVASFAAGYVCKSYGRRVLNIVKQISSPTNTKLVIVVRTDLRMSAGKIASQCSHASVSCYKELLRTDPKLAASWETQGQPKIVVRSNQSGEHGLEGLARKAAKLGLTAVIVRDAGRTEVTSGTATVLGIGPGDVQTINTVTDKLRLL